MAPEECKGTIAGKIESKIKVKSSRSKVEILQLKSMTHKKRFYGLSRSPEMLGITREMGMY